MVPPRLIRRMRAGAAADRDRRSRSVVLSPLLALLAVAFGLVRRRTGRPACAALRLLFFALVWLVAETAALFMCLALWIASGFGGRLHTEPYQSRHYAIMRWYLDRIYGAARCAPSACGSRWTSQN